MLATKSKALIPAVAEKTGKSEELVTDAVYFYYELLKNKMIELKSPTILVPCLGTFRISRKKVAEKIRILEKTLASKDEKDFKKLVAINMDNERLQQYKEALEICNEYYKPLYEKRNKNMEK